MIIDAHSHMFLDEYHGVEPPQSVDEVEGIELEKFVAALDRHDIGYVITLAQDMTKSWAGYLGSNSLAADL